MSMMMLWCVAWLLGGGREGAVRRTVEVTVPVFRVLHPVSKGTLLRLALDAGLGEQMVI